eukprot:gnl/Trimastix_PCT/2588.p1 GENE.gnl/Trimastix_PCT/2588~~gnl/Trimastix_PCT/2588.p1  ORF type:complete len:331 (+),score=46.86 gnl/Trimastix_PCT/2588:28-993(+)
MGSIFAKKHAPKAKYAAENPKTGGSKPAAKQPQFSWERNRPDPADFKFEGLAGVTVHKDAGSIDGDFFSMLDCRDSCMMLLDHLDSCHVDRCQNCNIYIGPTSSSVFLRDSENCNFVVACGQFRTRNLRNCRVRLYCKTKPIIESSENIDLGCFDTSYQGLEEQMRRAGLDPHSNLWSEIFDFTPGENHYKFLPPSPAGEPLMPQIAATAGEAPLLVPPTYGGAQAPEGPRLLVVAPAVVAKEVVQALAQQSVPTVRSFRIAKPSGAVKAMLTGCNTSGALVGFETIGMATRDTLQAFPEVHISADAQRGTEELRNFFPSL